MSCSSFLGSSHGEEHANMRVGVQVVVVTPQQVQLRHARARAGDRDISCGRRGCGWRRWSGWWVTLSNRVLE